MSKMPENDYCPDWADWDNMHPDCKSDHDKWESPTTDYPGEYPQGSKCSMNDPHPSDKMMWELGYYHGFLKGRDK